MLLWPNRTLEIHKIWLKREALKNILENFSQMFSVHVGWHHAPTQPGNSQHFVSRHFVCHRQKHSFSRHRKILLLQHPINQLCTSLIQIMVTTVAADYSCSLQYVSVLSAGLSFFVFQLDYCSHIMFLLQKNSIFIQTYLNYLSSQCFKPKCLNFLDC